MQNLQNEHNMERAHISTCDLSIVFVLKANLSKVMSGDSLDFFKCLLFQNEIFKKLFL